MKFRTFCKKILLFSMLILTFLFVVGCGSSVDTRINEENESERMDKMTDEVIVDTESSKKSISEHIDAILDKETITTDDMAMAYDLVKELEKDDEKQAKEYLQYLKYCMYEEDAYGLADGDLLIFGLSVEGAENFLVASYYGTWYNHDTAEMFTFTPEKINGRDYYVRSVYQDYSIMVIYGYLDEPDKLYCLESEGIYCNFLDGNGELVLYVKYNKDYVPGLTYMDSYWCNFDYSTHEAILEAYNEYLLRNSKPIAYKEFISNTVVPSYSGADTTQIVGDGSYFDEIVSGAWFDEYGQAIATFMPEDLQDYLFDSGYWAYLRNLHFIDGSNMTLDYVKRNGYSTDPIFDEIYAVIVTDIQKKVSDNGKKYMYGYEYFSGEVVVIVGDFNGVLNGDALFVVGPFHGVASDDTANFTGVWCELINNRLGNSDLKDMGFTEWTDDDFEDYVTSDIYDDVDTERYDMCDYLFGAKGTPMDFFDDIGCNYVTHKVGRDTYINLDSDALLSFSIYESTKPPSYFCELQCYIEGCDGEYLDISVAGIDMFMSYDEVVQMLASNNWTNISKIEEDELKLRFIQAEQGDCELSVGFNQGSIFNITYNEKQGYWSGKNGN